MARCVCAPLFSVALDCSHCSFHSHVSRRSASAACGAARVWHRWRTQSPRASALASTRSLCAQCYCLRSPLRHAHAHAPSRSRSPAPLPKRAPARRGSVLFSEGDRPQAWRSSVVLQLLQKTVPSCIVERTRANIFCQSTALVPDGA